MRWSRGPVALPLREMSGRVASVAPEGGAPFGKLAAKFNGRQWLRCPRAQSGGLNIGGPKAQVTVVAWIQRARKPEVQCEFIAGMWNETRARRQYGLFLDLRIGGSGDQVSGHVSALGGPSPGQVWCRSAAIGWSMVDYYPHWHCVGFTYDGKEARAYYNGRFEPREVWNPFMHEGGLFEAGEDGSDFTVGAVDRLGEMGNWFCGLLGGLAVYNRALSEKQMATLAGKLRHAHAVVPHPDTVRRVPPHA